MQTSVPSNLKDVERTDRFIEQKILSILFTCQLIVYSPDFKVLAGSLLLRHIWLLFIQSMYIRHMCMYQRNYMLAPCKCSGSFKLYLFRQDMYIGYNLTIQACTCTHRSTWHTSHATATGIYILCPFSSTCLAVIWIFFANLVASMKSLENTVLGTSVPYCLTNKNAGFNHVILMKYHLLS